MNDPIALKSLAVRTANCKTLAEFEGECVRVKCVKCGSAILIKRETGRNKKAGDDNVPRAPTRILAKR
jgi:DNA-directed RNA polymerase subunit RPC12/RpoP